MTLTFAERLSAASVGGSVGVGREKVGRPTSAPLHGHATRSTYHLRLPSKTRPSVNPASPILSPRKEVVRRLPSPQQRRPNTAGLKDHVRPWSSEKLQSMVTRNGIGSAVWRSTLTNMDMFSALRGAAGGEHLDEQDEDDAEEAARRRVLYESHREKAAAMGIRNATSASAAAAAAAAAAAPHTTRLIPSRFSYSEMPRDPVWLSCLRSFSSLRDFAARLPLASGQGRDVWDLVKRVASAAETQRTETRPGGASVRVIPRSVFAERVAFSAASASWCPVTKETQQQAIAAFREFCGGDNAVLAAPFLSALQVCETPSVRGVLTMLFQAASSLRSTVHCAEFRSVIAVTRSVAQEVANREVVIAAQGTSGSTGAAVSRQSIKQLRSFRRSGDAATADASASGLQQPAGSSGALAGEERAVEARTLVEEFAHLVETLLAPRSTLAPGAPPSEAQLHVVDACSWHEVRATILAMSSPQLSSLILDRQL